MMQDLKNEPNVAFLMEEVAVQGYIKDKLIGICDYIATIADGESLTLGWMYPKNSILTPLIDNFMLKMHEEGISHRIKSEKLSNLDFDCSTKEFVTVNFQFVLIIFIFLGLGIFLAIILVILEKLAKFQIIY